MGCILAMAANPRLPPGGPGQTHSHAPGSLGVALIRAAPGGFRASISPDQLLSAWHRRLARLRRLTTALFRFGFRSHAGRWSADMSQGLHRGEVARSERRVSPEHQALR